jgi:hypothetical protein
MAARKAACSTWRQVAVEFDVAVSTARQGVADHAAAGSLVAVAASLADIDPQAIFVEAVNVHRASLGDLTRIAAGADSDAARVGAIKARNAATLNLVGLLGLVGLLPDPARVLLARADRRRAQADLRAREALMAEAA